MENDGKVPCPHCGKRFKLVKAHITKKHATLRVEVRKVRNAPERVADWGEWDFSARVLRNGVVVGEWDTAAGSETISDSKTGRIEKVWNEFVWRDEGKRMNEHGSYIILMFSEREYAEGEAPEWKLYLGGSDDSDPFLGRTEAFGATCVFVE
jgi:hypothetical protein